MTSNLHNLDRVMPSNPLSRNKRMPEVVKGKVLNMSLGTSPSKGFSDVPYGFIVASKNIIVMQAFYNTFKQPCQLLVKGSVTD